MSKSRLYTLSNSQQKHLKSKNNKINNTQAESKKKLPGLAEIIV